MKKKVIITGGNGDIAKAIQRKLYENDYLVLSPGHKILDVTNISDVRYYFGHHRPDVLINNAGYISTSHIISSSMPDWKENIMVNLLGVYYCTRLALANGCKQIINIGSSAGTKGKPKWSAYCCSKRAVVSFTESLVAEGIESVCISPGRTDTKMRSMLFPGEDKTDLMTVNQFADKVYWIMKNISRYRGMDLVVKKEDGEIKIFYFKKVKEYVLSED